MRIISAELDTTRLEISLINKLNGKIGSNLFSCFSTTLWIIVFQLSRIFILLETFLRSITKTLDLVKTWHLFLISYPARSNITSPAFTCSKLTIGRPKNVWNLFIVHNKDTKTTSLIVNLKHISPTVLVFLLLPSYLLVTSKIMSILI